MLPDGCKAGKGQFGFLYEIRGGRGENCVSRGQGEDMMAGSWENPKEEAGIIRKLWDTDVDNGANGLLPAALM